MMYLVFRGCLDQRSLQALFMFFSLLENSSVWWSGDQQCNNMVCCLTGTIMLLLQPVKSAVPCEMVSQMQKLHHWRGEIPNPLHLCLSLRVCGCVFLSLAWFWPQQLSDMPWALACSHTLFGQMFFYHFSKVLCVSEGSKEQEGGRSTRSWETGEIQPVWELLQIWVPVRLQPKHQTSHLKVFKDDHFRHSFRTVNDGIEMSPAFYSTHFWWSLGARICCIDLSIFLYHSATEIQLLQQVNCLRCHNWFSWLKESIFNTDSYFSTCLSS